MPLPWPLLAAPRRKKLLLLKLRPLKKPLLLKLRPLKKLLRPLKPLRLLKLLRLKLLRPLKLLRLKPLLKPLRLKLLPSNWAEAHASQKGVLRHPFFMSVCWRFP